PPARTAGPSRRSRPDRPTIGGRSTPAASPLRPHSGRRSASGAHQPPGRDCTPGRRVVVGCSVSPGRQLGGSPAGPVAAPVSDQAPVTPPGGGRVAVRVNGSRGYALVPLAVGSGTRQRAARVRHSHSRPRIGRISGTKP